MLWQPQQDPKETVERLQKGLRQYETDRCYRWGIALGEELIGRIDLRGFDEVRSMCSFAYMLGEPFWGKGYGTEALTAVLNYAFSEMEMKRVEADHFEESRASGAVMRKAGMICQGTVAPE